MCNQNRVDCEQLQDLIEVCRENITECIDDDNLIVLEKIYEFCNATENLLVEVKEKGEEGKYT